jgi:hypothetical protein
LAVGRQTSAALTRHVHRRDGVRSAPVETGSDR